jgi:hypothetical protein
MAVPVNDFLIRVVGSANQKTATYHASQNPSQTRGIFKRKPKDRVVPLTEVVDQLNQDISQADLGNVTFNYGKGVVGSEGNYSAMFFGTPEAAKLQVQGSEVISTTLPFVTTREDYATIGLSSLEHAHNQDISDINDKNLVETFFTSKNVNADLTNISNINVMSPEAAAAKSAFGTVLHEFTHSANDRASFLGGVPIKEGSDYFESALDNLLDSDHEPLDDWMPDFQKNLNLKYAATGVEEARAELGRLSFLGHPSENISKQINPDYVSYIGRLSGEDAYLKTTGDAFRSGYTDFYETYIRNYTPQAFKDPTTGLVMDESEKWIQASLREAEMNAHAAGVMTILHNSEHIPGFQQQRELMLQMFEEEQKNNPEYGRAVANLRQDMFAPGEEPAFRVDIPGARYLDSPQPAVASSVAEVIEDSIGSGHTLSTATATAAEVATTGGAVTGTATAASSVVGAVGGGAGAAVTSTAGAGAGAAAATSTATAAAGSATGAATRSATNAGKNVSQQLVKGVKNVDNIRMAGVAAILGVGALAYSSRGRD